jgi:NADPH:quinone reductase-like Zn-dependent oxidoreductase
MRALRYYSYGPPDVLRIEELPEPLPDTEHAKVRVRAVALNPLDWKIRAGHVHLLPIFRSPPRGVGFDFAGEIVAVGDVAKSRRVGERVLGSLLPFGRDGACSEYIVVPYDRLLPLPNDADDVQAATLPVAGGTALQALDDDAQVDEGEEGERILITGAAGGVGHFAVQLAKYYGVHVVAVCSARNADFVRSLGADEVVDYAKEDFTLRKDRFDFVFDAACASSFAASRRVLTESGCYINTGGDAASLINTAAAAVFARFTSRQRAIPFVLRNEPPLWRRLLDFLQKRVLVPHVERTIAMGEVADAFRAMETGHGRGKIVVKLS